jgi:hypothetical protein
MAAGTAFSQVGPAATEPAATQPAAAVLEFTPSSAIRAPNSRAYEEWRKSMSKAVATAPGCFRADYPNEGWKPVPCTVAPLHAHTPSRGVLLAPQTVGAGVDYGVELPDDGQIYYSEGSFGTSIINGESDGSVSNDFSLQLNSNRFNTSACNGVAGCLGWQQYIFDNPGSGSSSVYIQYWLLNYPNSCPSGYIYFSPTATELGGCFKNSAAVSVPSQVIQNLSALALSGNAVSGGFDQALLSSGTSMYLTSGADTVLNLGSANNWTWVEFNVFGDHDGTQATFGSGTLISVKTMVSSGVTATAAPGVFPGGTTAETNNLTLSQLTCPAADPNGPYVWFQESFGATVATTCPVTPISLPAPTVTVTGPTFTAAAERFTFAWPNVPNATYYLMSVNGVSSTVPGNSSFVGIRCQQTALVTFTSCDAAGCGWPETVLNAKNTDPCN